MSTRSAVTDPTPAPVDVLSPKVREAWESAQKLWNVRMHDPHLPVEADITHSALAWFAFPPSVTVNSAMLEKLGASEEWESVFAHELGHHALAPSTRLDALKIRHQIARALVAAGVTNVRDEDLAKLSNLWTDLLVNARVEILQRRRTSAGADSTPGIVRLLGITSKVGFTSDDRLWWAYRRTYELLWDLTPETLCPATPPDPLPRHSTPIEEKPLSEIKGEYRDMERRLRAARRERQRIDDELSATMVTNPEVDAVSLARVVRTFAGDAISGALRFGMIAAPYVAEQEHLRSDSDHRDGTGAGDCAAEAIPATQGELGRLFSDRRLHEPFPDLGDLDIPVLRDPRVDDDARGQNLGLARTLTLYGPSGENAVLAAWYRAEASRWVRPFTERGTSQLTSTLPGPLELWELSDDLADLDWPSTLRRGPNIVPGVSTLQRSFLDDEAEAAEAGIELDLYLDASGSMPDPREGSPAVLAGTILALSVLRGGGRVRVTVFSGPNEVGGTTGFERDHASVISALAWYPGNGTAFPLDLFGTRYEHLPPADERVRRHVIVISDDGLVSMFGQGNEEFVNVAPAVRSKLSTATLVLRDTAHQVAPLADAAGYDVVYLESMEDAPRVCATLAEVLRG